MTVGDEAVVVGPLALGVANFDGEPVDQDGIGGVAQWHTGKPAVDGGGASAAFAYALVGLFQYGAVPVFGDGLMRGWLAGEDEVAAGVLDGGGDRLTGKQVVPEIDRPEMADRGTVPGQPSLGGIALAILLLRAILRGNELRRQGQDLRVARCHHTGAEEGVKALHTTIGPAPRRALRTVDLARAEVLAAVQRDQHMSAQALEAGQRPGCLHGAHEQCIERRRRDAVQHQADVVVRGDRGDAEQGLTVRSALSALQGSLMRQERRTSHEEQGERRKTDIGHRVVAVAARSRALVGKTGADRAQLGNQIPDDAHIERRIKIRAPIQAKSAA